MHNADDLPRAGRWTHLMTRVAGLDEGSLLRWALIANTGLVALLAALLVLSSLWQIAASVVSTLRGWF